jgi:hypothetical protein
MPATVNRLTDVEIPNRVLSRWIETGKARKLRRPLTADERRALEVRRDEIAPYLAPYASHQTDAVVLELLEMYSGFTSMRGGEEDAAARVDAAARLLKEFPAWAILKACASIRRNGVWRDGTYDRRWPPSDPEIVGAVLDEMIYYRDVHARAEKILAATVEEQPR